MHGHLQPVALGVHVRVGHRPGHGLPGLEPGPARVRAHGPGACPGPHPGHRRDPAARRRRLPPVPAAHEARQPRRGLGVQRRPGVARAGRRRLPQGDRRPLDPRRARARGTTPTARRRRSATTCGGASTSRWSGSGRTACRSSGGPTGTTASTSTSSRTGPASPSRRPPTGPAASPSRCSSPACSCSPRGRRRRSPACVGDEAEASRCAGAAADDDRGDRGARLGRGLVPAGVRPRRAARGIGRQRRGPDLHRAPGDDGDGGRRARGRTHADRDRLRPGAAGDAARDRGPAAGLRDLPPRAGRDLVVPARATRRTPGSSATPTRG